MFWYYFNHDNSFAYRSDDGQLAPSEVLKLGANIIEISMEQPDVRMKSRSFGFLMMALSG